MAMMSISGSSSMVQGVGLYLFGPNHCTGDVRSLKTGSSSILIPLDKPVGVAVSIRKEACPIHVAFSLSGWEAPHSGLRMATRPSRLAGTGTLFLSAVRKNFALKSSLKAVFEEADSHGLQNEIGGEPMWCVGFFCASGLGDGSLVIRTRFSASKAILEDSSTSLTRCLA